MLGLKELNLRIKHEYEQELLRSLSLGGSDLDLFFENAYVEENNQHMVSIFLATHKEVSYPIFTDLEFVGFTFFFATTQNWPTKLLIFYKEKLGAKIRYPTT